VAIIKTTFKPFKKSILVLLILLPLILSNFFALGMDRKEEPEMVIVKAGYFLMGDEIGDLWEGTRPVHRVELTYDYWIGKYPVTFSEYDAFCEATERPPANDQGWGREDRPVVNVTWRDAVAFCNWLSVKEGLQPAYNEAGELLDFMGKVTTDITKVEGYRLPTEAEWEYAASGGHQNIPGTPRFLFSGSNEIDEVAWYFENSGEELIFTGTPLTVDYSSHGAAKIQGKSTQPVGQKKPNELGIYDMSGNVWEWCHDRFGYYSEEEKINPIGAEEGHVRVMRGGSWIFGANDCRVGNRLYRPPHERIFRLGFRLARTDL